MKTRILIKVLFMMGLASLLFAKGNQYQLDQDSWNFMNFKVTKDPTKLWKLYSKSFLGIAVDSSKYYSSDAEMVFFNELIKKFFAGHPSCYGMSLLSLLCFKEGVHLGVCSPVYDYEGDLSGFKDKFH